MGWERAGFEQRSVSSGLWGKHMPRAGTKGPELHPPLSCSPGWPLPAPSTPTFDLSSLTSLTTVINEDLLVSLRTVTVLS